MTDLSEQKIDSYKERIIAFLELTRKKYMDFCNKHRKEPEQKVLECLNLLCDDAQNCRIHVDFDHHIEQVLNNTTTITKGRGEFADILLIGSESFISIEAKFKSDWNFKKDIKENWDRIDVISTETNKTAFQILLLTKTKLENSKIKTNAEHSQYNKLTNAAETLVKKGFAILEWEDISILLGEQKGLEIVKNYLDEQLK